MLNKKNAPLLIALAIPVVMILAVAAAIYLPGLGKSPKFSFVYVTGDSVRYGNSSNSDFQYAVRGDKVQQIPVQKPQNVYVNNYNTVEPTLFFYDVSTSQSRELTLQEAQAYNLDASNTSPDGYSIVQGNYSGGGLFGGVASDYNSWFIKGNNRSKKLNLKLIGTYNYDNFEFLGWVR